jgi:hypothetical protein
MSKCGFFRTKAEYLGHLVSREGLKMTSTKVDAVKKIDPSKINSITEVRAFLGLSSYYRKFIRRFAILAAPLIRLTRKDCDVPTESQL